MNELALCAGVGAMSLGVKIAVGSTHRAACYVEREGYAAEILARRMEEGHLSMAPIYSDLSTLKGGDFRNRVDLVTSGLPCQPYSYAGKQLGHDDDRALWPHFVRVVEECAPTEVFIENVVGFRKHFEPVWEGLRRLGFVWAPPLLSTASEFGAPHIRERFFALAVHLPRANAHYQRLERRGLSGPERTNEFTSRTVGNSITDTDSINGGRRAGGEDREKIGDGDQPLTDGDCPGRNVEWCGWLFDGERETFWHNPDRCGDRCRIYGTFWDSESPPIRVDAGAPHRVDEIRAVGNIGAPPTVYAEAFRTLREFFVV